MQYRLPFCTVVVLLVAQFSFAQGVPQVCKDAIDARREGRFETSLELYGQCLATGVLTTRNQGVIYNQMGLSYMDLDELNKAIEAFSRSLSVRPGYAIAYDNRGSAYSRLEKYDLALDDYNRSLARRPDNPKVLANRGALFYEMGDYQRALADLNRAAELFPEGVLIYYHRARTLRKLGLTSQALKDEAKVKEIAPDFDPDSSDSNFLILR